MSILASREVLLGIVACLQRGLLHCFRITDLSWCTVVQPAVGLPWLLLPHQWKL